MSALAEGLGDVDQTPAVTVDTLSYAFIAGIQQGFRQRLYDPRNTPSATDDLLSLRDTWREDGVTTVFTSGVYDMLHLDHAGYLLHTKALGAVRHYSAVEGNEPWGELAPEQQENYVADALSRRRVRLVVSVDGNASVAERKGNKADKGGTIRPVYSWETRALMVAGQSFIDPIDPEGERLLPVVDAVTVHGPHDFEPDSPHASHMQLVETLQPDVWAVFGESTDILDEAPTRPNLGNVALHCITDGKGTHYFEDAVMGKMSTTNIVKRILGA